MNNIFKGGTQIPQYINYDPPTLVQSYNTVPSKIPPSITTTGTGTSLYSPYDTTTSISSFQTLFISSLTGNNASFSNITASTGNINGFSTTVLSLDGNLLTTSGGDVLLNGIPIATTSNISSITDWALYPAVSTVNFESVGGSGNGQLINVSTINGAPFVNGSGSPSTWSQFPATNSIIASPLTNLRLLAPTGQNIVLQGVKPDGSDAGQVAVNADGTISFGTALTGQLTNISTINGTPYVPGGGGGGDTISGVNTFDTATQTAFITAGGAVGIGGNVDIRAIPGFLSVGGGNVSLEAEGGSGVGGLFGAINLTAQPGTDSGSGITTGGAINITANSGFSASNLTSKISLTAGGVNSYAGVASPIGSLFGYNFIQGSLGVSLVAGSVPSGFQVPGTVYLYGATGIELNSDVYTTAIFPYWNGLAPPADLSINGRTTISGNAYVNINNANTISFDALGAGSITGVQQINGSAYPPTISAGVASLNTLTGAITLTAGTNINLVPVGNDITINATGSAPDPNPLFSTITVASGGSLDFTASTGIITNVSTINGTPYIDPQSIIPYALSGTRAGAVIVNHPIGNTNAFPINTFTIVSQITFNIPTVLLPTDSVYYDGWILSDFDANFNSYWGVSYYTNTYATPTDLIGSTTTTANALNYSNIQQIYLATNLIIPPTHLTPGGTITLRIYCNPTSNNHYLTIAPINQARIGYVSD